MYKSFVTPTSVSLVIIAPASWSVGYVEDVIASAGVIEVEVGACALY